MYRVWFEEVNGMFSSSMWIETNDQDKILEYLEKTYPGFKFRLGHIVERRATNCFVKEGDSFSE